MSDNLMVLLALAAALAAGCFALWLERRGRADPRWRKFCPHCGRQQPAGRCRAPAETPCEDES
jgi:hypothetical protein